MQRVLLLAATLAFGLSAHAASLQIGKPAPDFSLKGSDGQTYKLSDFKGKKTVVLEWYNKDCPFVRKHYKVGNMQKLQKERGEDVAWLTILSSAPGKEGYMDAATAEKVRVDSGMGSTALLLDPTGEVGKNLYNAKTTPHMFIVNKQGNLVYQGAIDDQSTAAEDSVAKASNYVKMALDSLKADATGNSIKTATTTAYGCSIKYK